MKDVLLKKWNYAGEKVCLEYDGEDMDIPAFKRRGLIIDTGK